LVASKTIVPHDLRPEEGKLDFAGEIAAGMIADLTLVAPIRATIERGLIVPYGRHDVLVYRCRSHRDGQVDLPICPVFLRQRALNDVSLSALAISSAVHCWRSWRGHWQK